MGKIIWIIVIIIVAVALYNAFTHIGSGIKFESISGFFKIPSGLYGSKNSAPVKLSLNASNNNSNNQTSNQTSGQTNQPNASTNQAITPPSGFAVDDLSPYYGQIKISSVSRGGFGSYNYFILSISYSLSKPINITGWHLESNTGYVLIPTAVPDYSPGGVAPSADIILGKSQKVTFYSNASPLVTNLRINKCLGYLNNTYKFNPALPNNCPQMYSRPEISSFTGACQSLIISLSNCSSPKPDDLNKLSYYTDIACKEFINSRFNYNGCYNNHRSDADFFKDEWIVWLGGLLNFDPIHDKLNLFDSRGLLVDQNIY
ncbi:MAG: hypothetical protein ABSE68_01025 [Minisyncoccia bacterium]